VSAHYNTQLALLSAMALDTALTPAQLPWLATLPATSSALAFELHFDPSSRRLAVRMLYQDGPGQGYMPVPLPQCASPGGVRPNGDVDAAEALAGPGACELSAFVRAYGGAAIDDAGTWCTVCENAQMEACVAARARGRGGVFAASGFANDNGSGGVSSDSGGGNGGGGSGEKVKVAMAVVTSALGAGALAAGAVLWHVRRREAKWEREAAEKARAVQLHGSSVPL
jgi:hypothetical protein